jgi:hypothetical protein
MARGFEIARRRGLGWLALSSAQTTNQTSADGGVAIGKECWQ